MTRKLPDATARAGRIPIDLQHHAYSLLCADMTQTGQASKSAALTELIERGLKLWENASAAAGHTPDA